MRMSTAGMHNASISAILDHQVQMAKTQQQLTTGKKFQTASEDPIGATRAAVLDRTLADNAQFERNSNIIETRLNYSESGLADATTILQRVRELALQGANTTLGSTERKMLAGEVRQNAAALLDLANRTDANGEYLYSGTSTNTKPFTLGPTGVSYQGDLTNRQVRISPTQALTDGHNGADVFMGITEGNGTFATAVSATNVSGATIDVGKVSDASQWVADNYTIQFTTPTDWQVVDDTLPTPNVIASGTGFVSGQSISFLGINVQIQGTPATNDSFTVQPAQKTDMFAMIEDLALTLEGSASTVQTAAQFSHGIGMAISNLDQSLERTGTVRADLGSRLSAIDSATSTREDEAVDLQSLLSDLRDVDYASAISKLNQQYAGLQAAQAAYSRISQMSLFDYLR
jgi:flagellar hook-associated protein 3 FlgL